MATLYQGDIKISGNGKSQSLLSEFGVIADVEELNHLDGVVDNVQVQIDELTETLVGHDHDAVYDIKGSAFAVQENLDTVNVTLDSHIDNTDIHITTENKDNWDSAYTHSNSIHARIDATKVEGSITNGNVFIDGVETNVYSHPDSGITIGTYNSVVVDEQGHVISGFNPTTLAEYGITDAETKTDATSKLEEAKKYTDTIAESKSDVGHDHDDLYDSLGSADSALDLAKSYTEEVSNNTLNSAKEYTDDEFTRLVGNDSVSNQILNHDTSSSSHSDIRGLISNLTTRLNNFLDVDDTTIDQLSELLIFIDNNRNDLESFITKKADVVHTHAISDVTNLQTTLDGKSDTDHTHSYAGSSSVGGAANSANKVNSSLVVQLNGGTTEGTNSFTFNGSALKSINITPSAIGAAASGHTHDDRYYTETEIDTKLQSINTALNGKAASSHTHTISNVTNLQETLDGKASTNAATQSVDGLMSAIDKKKLDGIALNANNYTYTLPTAGTNSLGGVKTTSSVTSSSGYTACPIISGVPYYKDTNTTYNLGSFGVTATSTELNYCDGVTSNIQTQLNGKAASSHGNHVPSTESANNTRFLRNDNTWQTVTPANIGAAASGHTHNYAGSSSAGGAATSANKLNTNAGNATQPVYFSNGVPVATTYTLNKSVPSNAVFTDTTYSVATTSSNGLMSASDKSKLDSLNNKTLTQHLAEENMILTSLQYGNTLPAAGIEGRIFFKRVDS